MSTEVARTDEILEPLTGELIPATDMPAVADALTRLRAHQQAVRDAITAFTEAVIWESQRQGTKTLTTSAGVLEVSADNEIEWDIEELGKLRDLGLPEERFNELVQATVSYKVDGRVARSIESANEGYARVIGLARVRVPKRQYVRIR